MLTPEQLQEQVRQDAAARASAAAAEKARLEAEQTKKVSEHTYYARLAGMTHVFKNGHVACFTNGEYVTNREVEIQELDALCDHGGNHLISKERMPIQNQNDALVLKDVTNQAGGGGMVSSAHLAQLAGQRR